MKIYTNSMYIDENYKKFIGDISPELYDKLDYQCRMLFNKNDNRIANTE
jgi:hypothetical protein